MAVTEVVMGLGSWSVELVDAPRDVTDRLQFFGHVAIVAGRVEPAQYDERLLRMARYVGVLTRREADEDRLVIGGQGMEVWLGDSDDKGEVLEAPLVITNQTFANSIRAVLGGSTAVVEGTLHSVPGTYTGRHQWESRRKAIRYVCDTFGAEYRVNGDGTLDAGTQAQLYRSTPTCVIVRKGAEGRDLSLTGLPGDMQLTQDVEDFTTRVVLLAEGEGAAIATGSADITANPYKDLRGQPVRRTRIISESSTATGNAQARAQLQLNRFVGTKNVLRLSTSEYIVDGSFVPGDNVYVYDPDAGLYDLDVEIMFRGQRINPLVLRAVEASWPVTEGMTVAYRHQDGTWYDLTDYVRWETGQTTIGVGSLGRRLTSTGFEPVGPRPVVDSTIPGQVAWVLPFQTSSYVDAEGNTRASMLLTWQTPLNEDGSTILDGNHYEIQYRVSGTGEWQTEYAPWGATSTIINDLSPGVEYDFRIRLVDTSGHAGAWSAVETAVASPDTIPPSTPAPPMVAASPLALQIRHELGRATGGTFNLELDLDHLDIHVGTSSSFTPDDTTLAGSVPANAGMIQAQIPAVATVEVPDDSPRWVRVVAVDRAGNASAPSAAVSSSALLLDDAHISSLTVSKVSAGTISSNWLIGASIRTASSGQRVELNATGLHGYNSAGTELVTLSNTGSFTLRSAASGSRVEFDASGFRAYSGSTETVNLSSSGSFTLRSAASGSRVEFDASGFRAYSGSTQTVNITSSGNATIQGELRSAPSGRRIVVNPAGSTDPEIKFYPSSGTNETTISAPPSLTNEAELRIRTGIGMNSRRGELFLGSGFCYLRNGDGGSWSNAQVHLSEFGVATLEGGSATVRSTTTTVTVTAQQNAIVTAQQDVNVSAQQTATVSGSTVNVQSSGQVNVTSDSALTISGADVRVLGKFTAGFSTSAFVGGRVMVSGTAGTIFYGPTYASTPYPAAMVRSANNHPFNITGVAPGSFSWVWGGPSLTSSADHINWFGVRV